LKGNIYKQVQNTQNLHEKKFKAMEKERPDALEMAEKENEEGKAQENAEVRP